MVYSKLEVMGCSRIEGEGALGFEPAVLGPVLAVLKLTSCVTLATDPAWGVNPPPRMALAQLGEVRYRPERLSRSRLPPAVVSVVQAGDGFPL